MGHNRQVEKYNQYEELCYVFNSVRECSEKDNVSEYIIRHHQDVEHLYNGYFYKTIKPKPYMVKATCDWCGKEFDCQRFRTEDGKKHLFCSRKCQGEYLKAQTELNCVCEVCGKPYHRKQSTIKNNGGTHYCSRECFAKAKMESMKGEGNHQFGLKGSKNASWKSDEKISSYGYRLIRKLDHPFKNIDDFVFEHRLTAEQYLLNDENSVVINGKMYLSPDYIVHHIDFDRLNNNPNNLLVMTEPEHMSLHHELRTDIGLNKYCQKYNLDKQTIIDRSKNSKRYKPSTDKK